MIQRRYSSVWDVLHLDRKADCSAVCALRNGVRLTREGTKSMVRILYRSDWGARPARDSRLVGHPERVGVMVHHTAGPTNQSVAAIQRYHMDVNDWWDIGYNWLVNGGVIYEGVGWRRQGAHCVGKNRSHWGICWVGNSQHTKPATADYQALHYLKQRADMLTGHMLPVSGHRDHWPTACPGAILHDSLNFVRHGVSGTGDDMALTERDLAQIENIADAAMRRGVRYTDNGNPDEVWQGHTLAKVRAHLEIIEADVARQRQPVDIDALAQAIVRELFAQTARQATETTRTE